MKAVCKMMSVLMLTYLSILRTVCVFNLLYDIVSLTLFGQETNKARH